MSEDSKVRVKALRPFDGVEGWKDENSEPFEVSTGRFAELKANSLVELATKRAPDPENKRAPDPQNKSKAWQDVEPARRSPTARGGS